MRNKVDRRSFLKSSAMAGGGFMLSFSWFTEAKAANKLKELEIATQWSELTGYIKISVDNSIKNFTNALARHLHITILAYPEIPQLFQMDNIIISFVAKKIFGSDPSNPLWPIYATENGLNSRLDEIQSSILNFKLKKVDNFINKRKQIAKTYRKKLSVTNLVSCS